MVINLNPGRLHEAADILANKDSPGVALGTLLPPENSWDAPRLAHQHLTLCCCRLQSPGAWHSGAAGGIGLPNRLPQDGHRVCQGKEGHWSWEATSSERKEDQVMLVSVQQIAWCCPGNM